MNSEFCTLPTEYGDQRLPGQKPMEGIFMPGQATIKKSHQSHHQGSIVKTPSGAYRGFVSTPSGRATRTFDKKRDCVAWIHETISKISDIDDAQPLGEYLMDWFSIHATQLKPSTKADYLRLIQMRIIPGLGSIPLKDLRRSAIDQWYAAMVEKGVGVGQVCYAHRVLHKALQDAVIDRRLSYNPAHGAKTPKLRRRIQVVTPLNEEETQRFIDAALKHHFGWLFIFAVQTGMREGELLALKWGDIDLKTGKLHVQRNLSRFPAEKGNGIDDRFCRPKSLSSDRWICLGQKSLQILEHQKQEIEALQQHTWRAWTELDLVFPSSAGTPINPSNLLKWLAVICRDAHVRKIRFHDLRHICASMLLQRKIPIHAVSRLLGHGSVTITLEMYGHYYNSDLERAAKEIDAIFTIDRSLT